MLAAAWAILGCRGREQDGVDAADAGPPPTVARLCAVEPEREDGWTHDLGGRTFVESIVADAADPEVGALARRLRGCELADCARRLRDWAFDAHVARCELAERYEEAAETQDLYELCFRAAWDGEHASLLERALAPASDGGRLLRARILRASLAERPLLLRAEVETAVDWIWRGARSGRRACWGADDLEREVAEEDRASRLGAAGGSVSATELEAALGRLAPALGSCLVARSAAAPGDVLRGPVDLLVSAAGALEALPALPSAADVRLARRDDWPFPTAELPLGAGTHELDEAWGADEPPPPPFVQCLDQAVVGVRIAAPRGGAARVRGHVRIEGAARSRSARFFARAEHPTVVPGVADVSGRLAPEVVLRRLARGQEGLERCYDRALAADATLAGEVRLNLVVGRGGAVSSASASAELGARALEVCLGVVGYHLVFPPPLAGIVTIGWPLTLRRPDASPSAPAPPPSSSARR